jgi:uncharacterized protein
LKRSITKRLVEWKNRDGRLPLLMLGARQTGKTYILEGFGREEFPRYHRFDFAEDPRLEGLFEGSLSPERILADLAVYSDAQIDPRRDLIVFDEVQQCARALTSLKYFAEKMPRSFVAASGSLLGLGLGDNLFPVGKVERLYLHPMSFAEFLDGTGQARLARAVDGISLGEPPPEPIHDKIWEQLKRYFVTGGLPGAINGYREAMPDLRAAFSRVREIQKALIADYRFDISKHSGALKAVRIDAVLENVPSQLARENKGSKKFVFKDVLPSASRYSTLEGPIEWLVQAGLIHRVPICSDPGIPLRAVANEKRFKLYLMDVGLLGAMVGLAPRAIAAYDYGSYKGYFAENFVLQEMIVAGESNIASWARNTSEVEFLWERDGEITPVEVKAGISAKAKSLGVYYARYNPRMSVLLSGRPATVDAGGGRLNLPLYLASRLGDFV